MQIIGANWRVVTCYLILPKQTPKNLLKKIKSKGIETSKCVLNKLLKINIEIKKMKEEICLLFFFSRSFLLRIKLVLMSLYHFRWIFSFGFFFAFAFAFALLWFAFPRNRDIQVVFFHCFSFFFSFSSV